MLRSIQLLSSRPCYDGLRCRYLNQSTMTRASSLLCSSVDKRTHQNTLHLTVNTSPVLHVFHSLGGGHGALQQTRMFGSYFDEHFDEFIGLDDPFYDESSPQRCHICGQKMTLTNRQRNRGLTPERKLEKHMKIHYKEDAKKRKRGKKKKKGKKGESKARSFFALPPLHSLSLQPTRTHFDTDWSARNCRSLLPCLDLLIPVVSPHT
jgi:hypothetical protein